MMIIIQGVTTTLTHIPAYYKTGIYILTLSLVHYVQYITRNVAQSGMKTKYLANTRECKYTRVSADEVDDIVVTFVCLL